MNMTERDLWDISTIPLFKANVKHTCAFDPGIWTLIIGSAETRKMPCTWVQTSSSGLK